MIEERAVLNLDFVEIDSNNEPVLGMQFVDFDRKLQSGS